LEKFALLNLLRALDGLQGKKPAGENGAGDGSINGNISADGAFKGGDALGGLGGNEGLAAARGGRIRGTAEIKADFRKQLSQTLWQAFWRDTRQWRTECGTRNKKAPPLRGSGNF